MNSVRSAKGKNKIGLYQPLSLLDLVVYQKKEGQGIGRISEAKLSYSFTSLPFEHKKTAIVLFLVEILHKILREEQTEHALFDFVQNSIIFLDQKETHYENFCLQFLLKLTYFLGFFPESGAALIQELKKVYILQDLADYDHLLNELMQGSYEKEIAISNPLRSSLIDMVIQFYQLHFSAMKDIKSLAILREVLID